MSPIFGVDCSHYQGAVNWRQVRREGFDFAFAKCTEGSGFVDGQYARSYREARAAGLLFAAYHYVKTDGPDAEAANLERHIMSKSVPVMLDWERGGSDVHNLWNVWKAIEARRMSVRLVYAPHWYADEVGCTDLTGLPPIVASRYPTMAGGYASVLYQAVAADKAKYWGGYARITPTILQFSSNATVAGQAMDVDAFEGTRAELAALLGGKAQPQEDDMPSAQEIADAILSSDAIATPWGNEDNPTWTVANALASTWAYSYNGWGDVVPCAPGSDNAEWQGTSALGTCVQWLRALRTEVAGLNTAVAELAKAKSVDSGVADEIAAKVKAAISEVTVHLDTGDGTGGGS